MGLEFNHGLKFRRDHEDELKVFVIRHHNSLIASPQTFMKSKLLLRILTIAVCAALLFVLNRPTTHFPSHPHQAPEFELQDLKGNQVHLSDFRGKAIVLNVWATWYAPCRREIPWF